MLGARHAPREVFAGQQAALQVTRQAVGMVGRRAKGRDLPSLVVPTQDAVVGNVAPQQAAVVAKPLRAFAPAATRGDLLNAAAVDTVFGKALMQDFYRRVGVAAVRRERNARAGVGLRRIHALHSKPSHPGASHGHPQ